MGTKTQKLIVLILVISLLIPNINYYNQQIKAQSTQTKALEPAKQELLAQENLSAEAEDFTNSPVLRYVNAESFNKKGHVKRLKDEENLNTFMFKNADGTKTMYIMYENVKYIDKFGNIKDKDIG